MNFESAETEVFEVEGIVFTYNPERSEYLANDIQDNYEQRIKYLGRDLKKLKKKEKNSICSDIYSIYSEWNVEDNHETLYLLFSEDDQEVFTNVTTDNEHYPNPIEKL